MDKIEDQVVCKIPCVQGNLHSSIRMILVSVRVELAIEFQKTSAIEIKYRQG